jgi:repressor LexA
MDKIFTPIKERVLKYLEEQGISKQAFYSTTGLAASNFKGQGARSELGGQAIAKILSEYKTLDAEWLLTGVGDMLRSAASAVPAPAGKGLPLIPMSAVAGKGTFSYSDLKIEDFYYVADLKQADFLIRVQGDSMYPKYNNGDIVACRIVKDMLFWQWHHIHVLDTASQGILIKRVEKSSSVGLITLVSENTVYQPFDIPTTDILAVALVIGSICIE